MADDSPHFPVDEAWLARRSEPALEPGLPIVDTHHHLWAREPAFQLPELLRDVIGSGHDVRASVFIQCNSMYRADGPEALKPVGEVEYVNGTAAMFASGAYGPARLCQGIIGWAEPALGARVRETLEAQVAAGGGRFKGIRRSTSWDPDPWLDRLPAAQKARQGMMGEAAFRAGLAELAKLDLVFDALIYFHQLRELAALARALPRLTIVVNHFGGLIGTGPYAGKYPEIFPVWAADLAELARCPNVFMKLGGLGNRSRGFGFYDRPEPPGSEELAATWRPWVETAIAAFTPYRCTFESNFPVDKASCSYPVLWNAFKRMTAGYSADERTALFSGTAIKAYRLPALA